MASIRVLNPSIANQIAAGEVVDGPWSVVKELVENALDAASRHIDIHIEGGGVKRLLVADDGHGMTEADARLCIQRHATSKLRELGDLGSLASFGFRGEALAAIAAVSRMTLTTRAADQDSATQLRIEGGRILQTCRVGAPVGTRVEIRDLFFNTPARRKFLKTARWENAAVERTVRDIALPAHHVGLCVRNEDKIALDIQPVPPHAPLQHPQRMERAVACLGQNTRGMLYPFYSQAKDLAVSGYIAAPLITRRDSRGIKLFVNHRCVNDPQLTQAVRAAYRTLLEVGRLPLCALDIVLPGTDVDVNVHPQKQHVRFREADRVIRHLIHTLRDFLATTPWLGAMPSFAFSPQSSSLRSDTLRGPLAANRSGNTEHSERVEEPQNPPQRRDAINRVSTTNDTGDHTPFRHSEPAPSGNEGQAKNLPTCRTGAGIPAFAGMTKEGCARQACPEAWRRDDKEGGGNDKVENDAQANQPAQYRLPQNVASEVSARQKSSKKRNLLAVNEHFEKIFNEAETSPGSPQSTAEQARTLCGVGSAAVLRQPAWKAMRVLGQVSQTFIVLAGPEGMVVLDQHAAHERVVFEQLRRESSGAGVSRQALLLPVQITLQPDQMQALHEHHDQLLRHGLEVEPFGEGHAVIKALPAGLSHQAAQDMVRDALAELHGSARSDALLERDDRVHATVACHGSIRAGQRLTPQEIQALLCRLDTTPFGAHCPHGRPIARRFATKHMARWFDRT